MFVPTGDDSEPWVISEQSYDWKWCLLFTKNQDGSPTRIASYSGCGCAGGETVTLPDEGTMISSTLTRRKQVITKDALGRPKIVENYEWDGITVDTAIVNEYDALDHVTQTRQFDGGTGSGTHQDTTYDYDGYGRLASSRKPSQTAATSYSYYADNRLLRLTDGRGAYREYTYNDRGLPTSISYGTTISGMTVPASVTFDYDGAGNRILMEDEQGSVEYEYDQMSRMVAETRDFDVTLSSAPNGVFKLEYAYHLNGSLASLTDPFGDEIDYALDVAGRLTGVTGSSYGGVTAYADSAEYRASDVLKHLEYGNGQEMDATFNERMLPASNQVTDGTHNVASKEYEYFNTGQVYNQSL